MVEVARTGPVVRNPRQSGFNVSGVYETQAQEIVPMVADLSFLESALEPGELGRVAHYRVLKLLGSGGMGSVFEAEDTHLKRQVAIKVMKREYAVNLSSRERFLMEARAAASLESDHIATIYQVGMSNDVPFLAMQLLHGESLEARIEREAPLAIVDAMMFARQIVEGLIHAHAHGLVHRDIKPANIWLENDEYTKKFKRVKILDFGLARHVVSTRKLTCEGAIVGTPEFMSPEQACGKEVDYRSDLFSLGAVLYVMLTGRLPFQADTVPAMLMEICGTEVAPPSRYNSAIPREIDELVQGLMSKSKEKRPGSATEVAEAMDRILAEFSFLAMGRYYAPTGESTFEMDLARDGTETSLKLTDTVRTPAARRPASKETPPSKKSSLRNPFANFDIAGPLSAVPYISDRIAPAAKRNSGRGLAILGAAVVGAVVLGICWALFLK